MKSFIFLILLLFGPLSLQISAQNFEKNFILKKDHNDFKGSTEYFNFLTNLSLCSIEEKSVKEGALHNNLSYNHNKKVLGDWARRIGSSYSEEQQSIKNWSLIRTGIADGVELAGEGVDAFVSSGGYVSGMTKVGTIAKFASFGTKVISKGLRLLDKYRVDNLTSENMDNFTKMMVNFLHEKFDSGMDVAYITTMNDDQRYKLYNELRSKYDFEPLDYKQWPDKAKSLYIMKNLSKIAKIQVAFQEKNDVVMSKINLNIKHLSNSIRIQGQKFKKNFEQLKDSGEKVNENLEVIQENQILLNKKLEEVYNRINKNNDTLNEVHEDMMFVKTFAMRQMPASQQKLYIIKKILSLKNISDKDKQKNNLKKYEEQLDLLANYEKVQSKMKKLTTNASNFFQIANNLGVVSDTVLNDVNTGINAITKGVNINDDIMAKNPTAILYGISNIANIFGKKRNNPEAERHKQIMNGIKKLFKGQQTILKHIRKIQEYTGEAFSKLTEQMNDRFDHVVENQKKIIWTIKHLEQKITDNYIDTRHMLDTIYWSTK